MIEEKKESKKIEEVKLVKVMPLRDHVIHQNKFHHDLKKGVETQVSDHFIPALKTEKVI